MNEGERRLDPEDVLSILRQAGKLKETYRHCYFESGRRESVADHTFRTALLAMILSREPSFSGADMNKVIRMCLIHDLGESFTGDIPAFLKTDEDTEKEDSMMDRWVETLPEAVKEEWQSLLHEMDGLSTREARIYKALDKLEALIAHDESDIATWLPLEYELQLTYGQENTSQEPYLAELRKLVDEWTRRKIREEGTLEDR